MPARQGEVPLLTLFADIHYVFSPPHIKPPHHRFDKSSYVYLFHDPMQRRGRLEVANSAGTPEQDAFMGYLDEVSVQRSHKHPTLFTITVEGNDAQARNSTDSTQWHLPAPDQHNQGRYSYRLHTVDVYFWTVEDSNLFLDSLRRVLREGQLRILDAPVNPTEHRNDTMSPVVQKLEQAAISNPNSYTAQNQHTSNVHPFPGPPSAPTPSSIHATSPPPPPAAPPVEAPSSFAPMAYNPAAPAAPEKFAHREPTPPPPDGESGTGLAAAAAHDAGAQFGAPPLQHQGSFPQQPNHQPYMPGPPKHQQSYGFSSPPSSTASPPAPGIHRASTQGFPPPPPQPTHTQSFSGPPQGHTPSPHASIHQQQQQGYPAQPYASYPQSPGHAPVQSPGFPPTAGHAPVQSPGLPPSGYGAPPNQQQSQTPLGAYSQYNYAGNHAQQSSDPSAVHTQAYRPTEGEMAAQNRPAQGTTSKFQQKAGKLEKGVSGFLKRLDKKI